MKYAFARRINLDLHLPKMGAGGVAECYGEPAQVWDSSSALAKGLMAGGALVALGSVALAFLGPAKLMTTYLIASAVGASTGLGTYYYRSSQAECGDGIPEDFEAQCEAALANMSAANKTLYQTVKSAADAAAMGGKETLLIGDKTYTHDQAWKMLAAKLESTNDPAAAKFAKCIRLELENTNS